jgi:AcrR family transcriptional regulator
VVSFSGKFNGIGGLNISSKRWGCGQMGRKNRAAERREQIVTAFCDCVVDLGIEKASMGEVAGRLGMDRSSTHYYFRTREELVVEAARHTAKFYVQRMEQAIANLSPVDRAKKLVDFLFGPTFHQPRLGALIDELSTLGNRDPFFNEQVMEIFRQLESLVVAVIDTSFAGCPARQRHSAAYAIIQLAEGTTVFTALGFDVSRRLASRQAALTLLDTLS